jgi:hypothetical protein
MFPREPRLLRYRSAAIHAQLRTTIDHEMLTSPQSSASPRVRRTRFFIVLAVALLSIVIVGFTPSFYLRT